MEYYSAIKQNTFESVLMRWMNLEPIIQSEVSQKEKNKYHILTPTYMESRNYPRWYRRNYFQDSNGDTDIVNRHMDTRGGEEEKGVYQESNMETYITICKIDSYVKKWGICPTAQETQTGALDHPRAVEWGGRWEGRSKERGYMYIYG